ncbi:MAG: OmpA family protein [Geobacteraceae bacterium]|nr:OmpA family protein [Geobacteraceae bacterium]
MTPSVLFTYYSKRYLMLCLPVVFVLAGCATKPVATASLVQARSAYAKIQADSSISTNAPVASYEAGQALQRAEQATDVPTQEHLAYIAERKAQIAVADAEKSMAEKEVQLLQKEKDKVLLKSSEQEAEMAKREADQVRQQAKQLEAELAELKGKQTERGIVLTLGDVFFETGRATLMPGGLQAIDKLANFLKKNTDRGALIEGHTDSVGTAEFNMHLSQRRAEAVRDALLARGIGAERITAKGYGESYPVASNGTAEGRQLNRRVEIVVVKQ